VLRLAEDIRRDLGAGYPLTDIYRRNQEALGGLTYERFRQLVTRHIGPVRGTTSRAKGTPDEKA
jgi:hypothetical protein